MTVRLARCRAARLSPSRRSFLVTGRPRRWSRRMLSRCRLKLMPALVGRSAHRSSRLPRNLRTPYVARRQLQALPGVLVVVSTSLPVRRTLQVPRSLGQPV